MLVVAGISIGLLHRGAYFQDKASYFIVTKCSTAKLTVRQSKVFCLRKSVTPEHEGAMQVEQYHSELVDKTHAACHNCGSVRCPLPFRSPHKAQGSEVVRKAPLPIERHELWPAVEFEMPHCGEGWVL